MRACTQAWADIQEQEDEAGEAALAQCRLRRALRAREPLPLEPPPTVAQLQEKVDAWPRLRFEGWWSEVHELEEHLLVLGVTVDRVALTWEGPGGGGSIARCSQRRCFLGLEFGGDMDGCESSGSSGTCGLPLWRQRRRRRPPHHVSSKGTGSDKGKGKGKGKVRAANS